MKLFNLKTLALTTAVAATAFFAAENAQAQTQAFNVAVDVQNDVTFAAAADMDFGQLIAVTDPVETASIAMQTGGTLAAPTTSGGSALFAAVGGAPSAASVDITGVNGQNVNLTIDNVVNPDCGGSALALSAWQLDFAGGGDTAMTVGTSSAFALTAGPDTVTIGATLTTPAQPGPIATGVCTAGTFDLIASY